MGAAVDTEASALRKQGRLHFRIENGKEGGKALDVPTCSPGCDGQKAEELPAD